MKTGVVAGIIAGAVIVVLAAGTAAAGFYVNKLDTIYPNVSIAGINLSGLTVDQAKTALTDGGYEKTASEVAVTVNFSDGEKMTITGEESGVRLYAEDAAEAAYQYGREGSFFSNEFSYVKSMFSSLDVEHSRTVQLNEDYIRSTVNKYAKKFNETLMNTAYKVNDDSIAITKGSVSPLADADALYDLAVKSLTQSAEQNSPVTVDYNVGTVGGNDIDLQSIYDSIYVKPVDAVYDTATKQVIPGVTGISFDVTAAKQALAAAQTGATVTIPLIRTDPAVTTAQLQGTIFRDILSEKSTYVAGTANRVHNVTLAAAAMNGKILNPGETFSYNETLGERTTAKGYTEAGAYVGGQVVQEIGGGICQGSSTLYYCVLYANLEVVERSNHMFIVTYLPLGDDATVNWGTVDFKFKNNTEYPIQIVAVMNKGNLDVKILGTKVDTNKVEVKYEVISSTDFKTVRKEDPSIAAGATKEESSGHKGYVIDTYKYIYDAAGNQLSKTFLARNKYRVQDKVILVPVGTLTTASPAVTSSSPSASSSSEPAAVSPSPSADITSPLPSNP